ncbi:helix-turn-helix domain-containing protein [Nocardia terpenica]|uniref:DNA-binding protein n=1 Tax=Nocardia terpenica TaxID=455432 RepID=A0A291RIG4_9NOCA|nr:helix-turn-helix transcriptional regulator [Nocardia terpenica]ATL67088.1 DNA-binding protein [Nocardia terpenica]
MNNPATEPERHPETVADRLAREIKRRRLDAGLSQRELAARIRYSRQYVSMTEWEDATLPSKELVAAIDSALGADGALVALRTRAKADLQGTRLPSPSAIPGSAGAATIEAGRQAMVDPGLFQDADPVGSFVRSQPISNRAIASFTAVTRLLASQRQCIAPDALLNLIAAHRDSVAALFRSAQDESIKNQLGFLLGETSIVASRLWSAVGDRAMALANCAFARRLAGVINSPVLGGIAYIFESNLRSDAATLIGSDGDVVDGLRMLGQAAAVADLLPPTARARIAAEQAQAYAVLDLPRECRKALARARQAIESVDDADRTGLFSDWSPTRLFVYEGTCWLFLGEPQKAVVALNEALGAIDEGNQNVTLAARVDLGSAYVSAGELEEGCRILGDTYGSLAAMGNRRGIERARQAIGRLDRWKTELPVRELGERIESLGSQ